MNRLLSFKPGYFAVAVVLFIIEICIARYLHDPFIRPYIGDLLVVILIYAFVRTFLNTPILKTALAVLAFAFFVEMLQYFRVVDLLGLQHSRIAGIVIGTAFEWSDLLAYTAGTGIVLAVEALRGRPAATHNDR